MTNLKMLCMPARKFSISVINQHDQWLEMLCVPARKVFFSLASTEPAESPHRSWQLTWTKKPTTLWRTIQMAGQRITHTCTETCVHAYPPPPPHTHTYWHAHTHTCIHTHIHAGMHTHTHPLTTIHYTFTHIYICPQFVWSVALPASSKQQAFTSKPTCWTCRYSRLATVSTMVDLPVPSDPVSKMDGSSSSMWTPSTLLKDTQPPRFCKLQFHKKNDWHSDLKKKKAWRPITIQCEQILFIFVWVSKLLQKTDGKKSDCIKTGTGQSPTRDKKLNRKWTAWYLTLDILPPPLPPPPPPTFFFFFLSLFISIHTSCLLF